VATRSLEDVKIYQPLTNLSLKSWTEQGYQIPKKNNPFITK